MPKQRIAIAHSPDSDDAFMFYALATGKITSQKYEFHVERKDIEELNQLAKKSVYDITAISFHAYAYLQDDYALLASGSSFAENNYGPMITAKQDHMKILPLCKGELEGVDLGCNLSERSTSPSPSLQRRGFQTVAIPGELTTAFLLLKIFNPQIKHRVMRFDQIMEAVLNGEVDAGLLIHEGQLEYEKKGLVCELKLIEVWNDLAMSLRAKQSEARQSHLPLPLGGNAVKKSLGKAVIEDLSKIMTESIAYAREHHAEARDYAMQFKRELSTAEADLYLSWYANERTLKMGEEEIAALKLLYTEAFKKGLIPRKICIEIV